LVDVLPLSIDELTQLANKWAKLTKGVHGEQNGLSIVNVGRLGMWTYQKMKSEAFIHNDDVMCFHVDVQGTQKMVVMGNIKFEDQALIKRWWGSRKNECDGWEAQVRKI
jgi:hypothetical protein